MEKIPKGGAEGDSEQSEKTIRTAVDPTHSESGSHRITSCRLQRVREELEEVIPFFPPAAGGRQSSAASLSCCLPFLS